MRISDLIKFFFLFFCFSTVVLGQKKQILLNVSVLNYEKETVKDLKRENFRLYENDKPVEISYFSNEKSPISAGILIDVSQSVRDGSVLCRQGILNFLGNSDAGNEYFVTAFGRKVDLLSDFADTDETIKIVGKSPYFSIAQKSGETALFDVVKSGIENFSKAKNQRKILFILWDEGDKYPTGSFKELEKIVKEKNIAVYSISCRSAYGVLATTNFDLNKLAEISGGKSISYENQGTVRYRSKLYPARDLFMLKFSELADQLQNQYVIGFEPNLENSDNKWRKMEVKLELEKELKKKTGAATVFHRKGYYPLSEVVTSSQY